MNYIFERIYQLLYSVYNDDIYFDEKSFHERNYLINILS